MKDDGFLTLMASCEVKVESQEGEGMSQYTAEQLGEIIAKHKRWLMGDDGGSRADLSGADLRQIGGRRGHEVNTFLSVAGIGREGRQTLFWVEEDKVWCGCFNGSLAEFEAKVEQQHGDSTHGQNYRDAIVFMKSVALRGKE